jgi:hypothetical protein
MLGENAFMLYAGQEYGERGMDCEGFSGHDGRTTIFDYWSVDTLCRADSGELTPDEQSLYEQHRSILNIARKEKAVTDGVMFDLMYVNQHIGDRQYAFLRKAEKDLMLVVANFADEDATADVCIPRHAFDYLHLAEGSIEAKDLLSGSRMTLTLEADKTVRLSLPPRGGCILKMTF